jgi:hypothetical protein
MHRGSAITTTDTRRGDTMHGYDVHYDLHHLRSAELRREAERQRLAREAVRHRRAARAEGGRDTAGDAAGATAEDEARDAAGDEAGEDDQGRRRRWFRAPRAA